MTVLEFSWHPFVRQTGHLLSRDENPMMIMFYQRAAIKRGAKLIKDHGGGDLPVDKYEFYSDL